MRCTEFLDEEPEKKEKAIQYYVKDEVGALAKTLQVVSVSVFRFTATGIIILFCTFYGKDMGINISGVNLDHLPTHIRRTIREGGLKINFIECSIESRKNCSKNLKENMVQLMLMIMKV